MKRKNTRFRILLFLTIVFIIFLPISIPLALGAIIADHTTTNLNQIPAEWINSAKNNLRVCYGHTSHGFQIVSGMHVLRSDPDFNNRYDFNTTGAIENGVLSLEDGVPSGDLGNPNRTAWANRTRTHLNGAGSDRNVVIWSWCGQVSDATRQDILTYLNLMNQLEQDFPQVAFIYMTGHLDGTGESGNLHRRNQQIRNYCITNNKILFDFADIESYDPSGNYYLDRGADDDCSYNNGNWAGQWCNSHPGSKLCDSCSCDCPHTRSLNCNLKARAFWWLLARIAGWEAPKITIIQPAAGDVLPSGVNCPINWELPQSTAANHFSIKRSLNNGKTWKIVAKNVYGTSYNDWNTPIPLTNKPKSLLKIFGHNENGLKIIKGRSDGPFKIEIISVTEPNEGAQMSSGASVAISWMINQTKRPVFKVKASFTKNAGKTWKKIPVTRPIDGWVPGVYTQQWTVPEVQATKTECRIKVILLDRKNNVIGKDKNPGYFTITP